MKRANIFPTVCLTGLLFLPSCDEVSTGGAAIETAQAAQAGEAAGQAQDMGKEPWVMDIEEATVNNTHYRHARWTGEHLQMVLMSLKPGEEIALEVHDDTDQFIRIEKGEAQVRMGKSQNDMSFEKKVSDDWAIFIPAGYYHHIKNIGDEELKLYSIYAPPAHPAGTLHKTYEEAREDHDDH